MTNKILITGGAGFIGSHVCDLLLSKGYDVRVLDSLHPQVHGAEQKRPEYLDSDVELIVGDCADKDVLKKCLKGVNKVVHFAARVGVGQSMYDIEEYCTGNTSTTASVLECIRDADIEKLVVASSMSVYGEGLYQDQNGVVFEKVERKSENLSKRIWEPLDEKDNPLIPIPTHEEKKLELTSVYALTKYDQEQLCMMIAKAYDIPTVALRFFNVYGTRQALSNPYTGVLAIFASRFLNDHAPLVYEDGNQVRDFINVKDIAKATCKALESSETKPNIFNVGTGKKTSIRDIAKTLADKLGKKIEPQYLNEFRQGDIRHCYADTKKAKEILDFEAEISFSDGIEEYVEWLAGQKAIDQVSKAHQELSKRGLTS